LSEKPQFNCRKNRPIIPRTVTKRKGDVNPVVGGFSSLSPEAGLDSIPGERSKKALPPTSNLLYGKIINQFQHAENSLWHPSLYFEIIPGLYVSGPLPFADEAFLLFRIFTLFEICFDQFSIDLGGSPESVTLTD